jgi:predicted porin
MKLSTFSLCIVFAFFANNLCAGNGNVHFLNESPDTTAPRKTMMMEKDGWTIGLGGNVNGFYIYTKPDANPGKVDGNALLTSGKTGVHSIQNGLLPTAFTLSGSKTTTDGVELGVTISLFAGTNSNSGLAYSELDLRQTFMTVGKAKMGTFTVGRNFGLFGFDAIINDMSLIGVGATALPKNPLNTTLGGIGYGYVYCDRLMQINYSTPKTNGFQLTLGVFNPLNTGTLGIPSDAGESNSTRPGIHGKATYGMAKDKFKLDLSASFISQSVETVVSKFSATGFDVYAKLGVGPFGLGAYYYSGKGLGTTVLLFDAADTKGVVRSSSGYYLQPSITFGKSKIGVNYGVSLLDKTTNDAVSTLKQHTRMTVGLYQTITEGLTGIVEFTSNQAKSHAGATIKNTSFSLGLFLGF